MSPLRVRLEPDDPTRSRPFILQFQTCVTLAMFRKMPRCSYQWISDHAAEWHGTR
jgi:hypothetical protein